MAKYVKLFNQFVDFVNSVKDSMTNPYERKIVNLILENFDNIADSGTVQGRRGLLMNSLIQKYADVVSDTFPEFKDAGTNSKYSFQRLASIELEHFRGFTKKEVFTFDKDYTFIYGPNGSGKSSFCEALEYSLLGYVNEAINRRIEITQYIRNVFTGHARKPKLLGFANDGQEIDIKPDPGMFNFCFIEKNRIEDFGKISANTPGECQHLLAALFGLTEFNDFVNNFTENIEKYLDVEGKFGLDLKKLSASIEVQIKNIERTNQELVNLDRKKVQIAELAGLGMDFLALDTFINGNDDNQGRLGDLNSLLSAPVPREIQISSLEEIDKIISEINADMGIFQKLYDEYKENREKVQFRALYTATVELQNVSADKCPVCETPIGSAKKHPFHNAKDKLKELEQIAMLESRLKQTTTDLKWKIDTFASALQGRQKIANTIQMKTDLPILTLIAIDVPNDLMAKVNDFQSFLEKWDACRSQNLELDNLVEKNNKNVRDLHNERSKLEEERKKLSQLSRKIIEFNRDGLALKKQVDAWEKEVDEFKAKNAALIKKAQDEYACVLINKKFAEAYHLFISRLSSYRNELPIRYLSELNSLTIELYNIINEPDRHYEKVLDIRLPSTINESIGIVFADKPDQVIDALHVLSEGHIRCLGLAILLAKNIHEKSPLLIFDDVVNAIDDDHRGGVRNLIFSKKHIKGKQVILTTHAEQFVNELEQHPPLEEYERIVQKLAFFIDEKERVIRIKNDRQKNYLHKIEKACVEAEWKEALYNSRCCLECLTSRLWRRLSKMDFKTEFHVVIRSPNGMPDLMSVVSSLNKFLKGVDGADKFKDICDILGYFLGLESKSKIIWQYLNKGTHEEEGRSEFDQNIVKEIAEKLVQLDLKLKQNG